MFRISLRELFVVVAVRAVALVSLIYASDMWLTITLSVASLTLLVVAIVSAVDRGPRQAFALGFVATMLTYGLFLFIEPQVADQGEFDLWSGHLPTTKLLRYAHLVVQDVHCYDSSTGKELVGFDPANPSIPISDGFSSGGSFGGGFGNGGAPAKPRAMQFVSPAQDAFARIGHLWWALLLGYVGGRIGRFVYTPRVVV